MLILALATASFDIFLNVNVAGFNFRASQVLLWLPALVALGRILQGQRIVWPVGFTWLMWWVFVIFCLIPLGPFWMRSAGYGAWLFLNVLAVFTVAQLFSTPARVYLLVRWYLYAFGFVAAFGLVQFFLPVVGLPGLLVTQWWVPGFLPRINGFSYEPSFYATYLVMGWILATYLLAKRSNVMPRRHLWITTSLITLALLLCSSRMGLLMMFLWVVPQAGKVGRYLIARLGGGTLSLIGVSIVALVTATVALAWHTGKLGQLDFLLGGTGLAGTPAHSVDHRLNDFVDTLRAFAASPWFGYSLGGVAIAVGAARGLTITTNEAAKLNEGMSVFGEVLAASGLIGFVPFAVYIFLLVYRPFRLAPRLALPQADLLRGLAWALVFEFIILQFNQNILRPYLWFHIAILSATFAAFTLPSACSRADARETQRLDHNPAGLTP